MAPHNANLQKQIYILYVQDKHGNYQIAGGCGGDWLEFKSVTYAKEPACPHK